ncbi:MAG TPA: quinone-dependent dihydroorotate dehydrogenase [Myxococcaceae bacterium]|nr:quinone-dependent dihydroorotate dehydrogenase [Myxococcaceae bacterium]
MYRSVRPLLFLLPPEAAHGLGMWSLRGLGSSGAARRRLRARALEPARRGVDLSVSIAGLRLEHPIALAAGLDKDARAVDGLFALGFSAVEIGTITPRPQPGNPPPRLFRLPEHEALINRMGFNNSGAVAASQRLRALIWRPGPVGANIGKSKATPIERAADDYLACVDELAPWSDYVVVNASSPNTPGLRQLQEPEHLAALLKAVRTRWDQVAPGKPLLLKIAPDLGLEAVDAIVDLAREHRVDGLIATNTTITRPVRHPIGAEAGGLSGRPIRELATRIVFRAYERSGGALPIIGVGGVFTGADAYEKIRAGASAVQLYTGFIYGGPDTVHRVLAELVELLRRDGFQSLRQAFGADHRAMASTHTERRFEPARG